MTTPIASPRPAVPTIAGKTMWALGTFCSLLVTTPGQLAAAQRILAAELAAIDLACSRFRPDSELAMVNRAGGWKVAISPLFAEAIDVALRAARITGGDVDPTCGQSLVRLGYDRDFAELAAITSALNGPPVAAAGWHCVELDAEMLTVQLPAGAQLDLGATAKALAADRAATTIAASIGGGVLVNLGGDIAVAGPGPEGGWAIAIDDMVAAAPRGQGQQAGRSGPAGRAEPGHKPVVAIFDGGVATSGPGVRSWRRGDERMHHILVPSTGRSADIYWAAVTVAAATCVDANTAATAAIIRGRSAPAWLDELGLPARLVRPDGAVVAVGGWPECS